MRNGSSSRPSSTCGRPSRPSREARPVHVVCAGTDGLVSFEDSLLAGALHWGFPVPPESANDQALLAALAWDRARAHFDEKFLATGRGGRRVREIGLEVDLVDASRIDRFDLVAELRRDPLRIVRA